MAYASSTAIRSRIATLSVIFKAGGFWNQEDINGFFSSYSTSVPRGTRPKIDSINGAIAPGPVSEGDNKPIFDLELAHFAVYSQEIRIYQVNDLPHLTGKQRSTGSGNTFLDPVGSWY